MLLMLLLELLLENYLLQVHLVHVGLLHLGRMHMNMLRHTEMLRHRMVLHVLLHRGLNGDLLLVEGHTLLLHRPKLLYRIALALDRRSMCVAGLVLHFLVRAR